MTWRLCIARALAVEVDTIYPPSQKTTGLPVGLHLRLVCDILERMTEDRPFAVQGLHFTGIAHNLERVADQATNICEDIVSMIREDSL